MSQMKGNTKPNPNSIRVKKSRFTTAVLMKMALLIAMAVVLQAMEFKVPFTPPWLSIDLSDLPAMLGGIAFGPWHAVIIEVLKNVLKFVTKGTITMGIGELANFVTGCALCVPVALFYARTKKFQFVALGMVIGVISFCVIGAIMNIALLMPLYMEAFGGEAIISMAMDVNPLWNNVNTIVLLGVTPFNLIKGILVSAVTLLLYKPLAPILNKEEQQTTNAG